MITISLNIQQQVHPVIWSLNNLPYDCVRAVAVNKPIGGVLVLAVNSLIYLNQSVPPYGVALNSLAESTTNFPLSMIHFFVSLLNFVASKTMNVMNILF